MVIPYPCWLKLNKEVEMCSVCGSDRPIRRILWGASLCGACSKLYIDLFRYQQQLGLKGPIRLGDLQKVHSALSWKSGLSSYCT